MPAPIVSKTSRLNFATYVLPTSETPYEYFNILDLPSIPDQVDDISYVVKGFDRIDQLAFKFYKDPILWWVIAVANDMELLPTDLIEGETIRIPSPRFVTQELFSTPIRKHG